jgi:hypothetical protein
LDHGSASPFAGITDKQALITVHVLTDNPFYVCYTGSHAPAGYVAWVTIAFYVIGYPLASLMFVYRRISVIMTRSRKAGRKSGVDLQSPSSVSASICSRVTSLFQLPSSLDASQSLRENPTLVPFTAADYRASVYWFRHIDMAVMLVLSLLLVFWARPTTVADIIGKAVLSVGCAVGLVVLLWRVSPYPTEARWKLRVRSFSLLLTALAAIVNCVTALASVNAVSPSDVSAAITALSVVLVAGYGGLLITLILSFCLDMVKGAKREQKVIVARRLEAFAEAKRLSVVALEPSVPRSSTRLAPTPRNSSLQVLSRPSLSSVGGAPADSKAVPRPSLVLASRIAAATVKPAATRRAILRLSGTKNISVTNPLLLEDPAVPSSPFASGGDGRTSITAPARSAARQQAVLLSYQVWHTPLVDVVDDIHAISCRQ